MILADMSIKRPVFITVIIIVFLVVGILCYTNLNINDMPEADMPTVSITVVQRGASPDQIETKVTKIIEEAVGQVSEVNHITSNITDGVSNTVVEFSLDKSSDVAAQEVKEKISSVRGQLPQDIDEPIIAKYDLTAKPIVSLAVTGTGDTRQLSQWVDDVVKKRLFTVKGVGAINEYGNGEREIQIKLDKEKLAEYGLTTSEVINNLKSDNLEIPGGSVNNGSSEVSLKVNSNVKSVQDFNDILVAKRGSTEIHVRDIAEVIDGTKDKDSLSFYQGKPAIGIDVVKQSGANVVKAADGINKEISSIKASLPEGINIYMVRDNSQDIRNSVNDVMKTIIEGCLLAIVIVFLFLKEWRTTLISAISLPTSIITTFIAMKVMNFSLNTLSLMGLSLSVGLLIDDAIVVIENIVRHMHMGKTPLQAAKEATSEIGLAVLATTLAVVAVFMPVAMVGGMIGKYFSEFGLTVAVSMLVSLFISFTLVPMMSSRILKAGEKKWKTFFGRFLAWFNRMFDKLAAKYSRFLSVVLHHRLITIVLIIMLFASSIGTISALGFSFIPSTDQGQITIDAGLDSGMALEAAGQKAKDIESIVRKFPEVKYIYTTVQKDNLSFFVRLSDKNERKDNIKTIISRMREQLKMVPGIELSIGAVSVGVSIGKDVTYNIKGDNYEQLQAFALEAKKMLSQDPHAMDVSINDKAGKPEATLEVNREKAQDLGVNSAAAADAINTLFNGVVVSKFDGGKDRYDVRVSMKDNQRRNLDDLSGVYVSGTNNQMVPLEQVTHRVFTTTAAELHRYDRTRVIELSANVSGMASGDFQNTNLNKLKTLKDIPKGITVELGGMNASMQDGFIGLLIALLMGVLFIFLVMAAQFESYIDPFAIMFSLPMALIGAVFGLFIAGDELSIMAMIGVILLMGLVAKNAILLIDFAKQKRAEGIERNKALIQAGLTRFRPIMMTSLAMIFGMIPTAIGTGAGTEMRAPMAHAVIGGLITSTILTLFVVPVAYTLLDDVKGLFGRKVSAAASKELV